MEKKARSSSAVFRALHELAVVTSGRTSPSEVAQAATRTAAALFGASATMRWWDAALGELVLLSDISTDGTTPARPPAGGAASRAFASGQPVVVENIKPGTQPAGYPPGSARSVAAVPLLVGDRVLGTLAVRSDRPRAFGKAAVRLLQLIAAQAGPALAAAHDAAGRERNNRTLVFLHELAVASGGILDLAQLADLAARRAAELLGCDGGGLGWADGVGELYQSADTEYGTTTVKAVKGVLWRAYSESRAIVAEDYVSTIGAASIPGVVIRSALAVPLLVGERSVGALGVRSRTERRFGPEDVQSLQLLAAQVAPAIERALVHRELERRTAAMLALDDIASAVGNVLDEGGIVAAAVDRVKSLLRVDAVGLAWFDTTSQTLRMVAAPDGSEAAWPGESMSALVFESGRPMVADAVSTGSLIDGPAAVAVVPLRIGERVLGTLGVTAESTRSFAEDDVQVLSLVAAQLAPALEAARLHADLAGAIAGTARRAQQQEAVANLGRFALTGVGEEEVMAAAVDAIREGMDADFIGIHQVDRERNCFIVRHLSDRDGLVRVADRVSFDDWPVSARAFREGAVIVADLLEEPGFASSPLLARGARSALTVRIGARGEEDFGVLGAVSVHPGRYNEGDLGFLSSVANVLAEAIARRQAEEELRRSRRELQTVLDHAGVVLFALDSRGRFRMAEGQTLSRMGVRREDIVGQPLASFLPDDPRTQRAVREALRGRLATYVHLVGGRDLDVVLHPVIGEDGVEVTGVIGVAIDVTQRRLAEVAQQESEAKSRFLAAMSHELRTPLNAVLGFAQLMTMDTGASLTDRQRRYLDNIEQSGRHLLSLINDVLDLSRVAAGQMPLQLQAVAIETAIQSVVDQARSLVDEKGLSVSVAVGQDLVVRADPRRFEQVVWNLLSNAIKFTDAGGRIAVGADAVVVEGTEMVELWVTDTGIGIAPEQLETIFDEFTQVESSLTRNHQGTGLGLALSRRLVELMGGSIAVSSVIGSGSRFAVLLPAEPRAVPAPAPAPA